MSRPNPVTFRPSADLTAWLEGRAERSSVPAGVGSRAHTELMMWRAVLAAELQRQRWTLDELAVIALSGSIIADAVPLGVGHVLAGVIDSGIEVDDQLLGKLGRLGSAADMALADAVSRWCASDHEHTVEGWAAVGVRAESSPLRVVAAR